MNYETIEFKIPYPGLKKTLKYLVQTALLAVPYCAQRWGTNNDLRRIWTICKQNTIYMNDAHEIEQIQNPATLFENNIHGISGAGDCDCFSALLICMLVANGYDIDKIYIYLQGNKKQYPSHILIKYDDVFLDLTQTHYNTIRNYNYFDILPVTKFL